MSLTMPVRRESYRYDGLHPVFRMNLPEGALREALERMTAKQYGSDDLTLSRFV
ncbi:MAG TPA: HipA N-terminal domain-containing protein [Thiolinea sp.]|nr:HipA N-terminal domain-containing protein [Thiolinea sp.]